MYKAFHYLTLPLILVSLGCAYHFGLAKRQVPGGYRQIAIPIFKNLTQEPGIEVLFTNALIQELERAKIASVVDKNSAEAIIDGQIDTIDFTPGAIKKWTGAILATEYHLIVTATISVRRNSDQKVYWTSQFSSERIYPAPQVTTPGINSVNPLYNLSARRQNLQLIAEDMMAEAYDKMTENF